MSIENLISLREKDSRNVIGLMSGTSCDGIEEGQWEDRVRSCFLRNDMEIEELSISLPYYYSVLNFLYANSEEEQDSEELNEYLRFKYR